MPIEIKQSPSLSKEVLLQKVKGLGTTVHARFINEMFPALWDAAVKYDIDPVGMVAQALHETDRGNYTGNVVPEMHNTAGIKWHDSWRFQIINYPAEGDAMLSHAAFANWRAGTEAHAQHVLGYMGIKLPPWQVVVDPRYPLALDQAKQTGPAKYWSQMGGYRRWAPNPSYGNLVENMITTLMQGQST